LDLNCPEAFLDRSGCEKEIDPQPMAAAEGATSVVPPGEGTGGRMAFPEQILEAQAKKALEANPFLLGVEESPGQLLFVPAVKGCRTDVEIAAQNR
jgi:hypothetical protein